MSLNSCLKSKAWSNENLSTPAVTKYQKPLFKICTYEMPMKKKSPGIRKISVYWSKQICNIFTSSVKSLCSQYTGWDKLCWLCWLVKGVYLKHGLLYFVKFCLYDSSAQCLWNLKIVMDVLVSILDLSGNCLIDMSNMLVYVSNV